MPHRRDKELSESLPMLRDRLPVVHQQSAVQINISRNVQLQQYQGMRLHATGEHKRFDSAATVSNQPRMPEAAQNRCDLRRVCFRRNQHVHIRADSVGQILIAVQHAVGNGLAIERREDFNQHHLQLFIAFTHRDTPADAEEVSLTLLATGCLSAVAVALFASESALR